MLLDEPLELGDELLVPTERELGVGEVLLRFETDLREPAALDTGVVPVLDLLVRRAAPQPERALQRP